MIARLLFVLFALFALPAASQQPIGIIVGGTPIVGGSSGQCLARNANGTVAAVSCSNATITIGSTLVASGTTTRVLYDAAGTLGEYSISGTGSVAMTIAPTFGNIAQTLAATLTIPNGTNGRASNATLAGFGTATVANTTVTANTVILLTRKTQGGTPGHLHYTLDPGVGFTIVSNDAGDTSIISYWLLENP